MSRRLKLEDGAGEPHFLERGIWLSVRDLADYLCFVGDGEEALKRAEGLSVLQEELLRIARTRIKNADAYLADAQRALGYGDYAIAANHVKRARQNLTFTMEDDHDVD